MKKPASRKKNTAIILISLVVLFLLAIVAVIIYLLNMYNKMYEPVDIVDRSDSYVMPEYPELDYETSDVSENTTADETEYSETETVKDSLPMIENSLPQYPNYNYSASFGNSPNAISVYGGVPIYKVTQKDPDVINILLLGTDSRDVTMDRGRSDTMIVVSYNKSTGEIKLVSFLRDALVPIEGCGWNRLNSAYAFGGVGLSINTINQLFDLDIQQFVVVDMNGTKDFMNRIGGIDVTLTEAEAAYYNHTYKKNFTAGVCHLDGDMALKHMRNRSTDSDFGRTRRQRDVITAVIKKLLQNNSLSEILDLMDYVTSIVKTNIDAMSMAELVGQVVKQKSIITIDAQNVPYSDAYSSAWYNGMSILSFDIAGTSTRINDYLY